MKTTSWKTFTWFAERMPDLFMWSILLISIIVFTSALITIYRSYSKKSTKHYSDYKVLKICLCVFASLLLPMMIGLIFYRLEAFWAIMPYFTTHAWKLYLFTSFVLAVTTATWTIKGIINHMFLEWARDWVKFINWFKKMFLPQKQSHSIKTPTLTSSIVAPVDGYLKKLEDVKDKVFAKKIIGEGIAIEPTSKIIYAPISGILKTVFPTGHAYGITDENDLSLLIHVGIDTVKLNGEGFESLVKQGQKVQQGQALAKINWQKIKGKKFITDVLLIVLKESHATIKIVEGKDNFIKAKSAVMEASVKEEVIAKHPHKHETQTQQLDTKIITKN